MFQFHQYRFAHHPQKISIQHSFALPAHFAPYQGDQLQSLGPKGALIRCEGALLGQSPEDCEAQLTALLAQTPQGEPALLYLPYQEPFYACLSSLATSREGDGTCMLYTLEFLQCPEGSLPEGGSR